MRELLQPFVNHMANEFSVYFESDDDAKKAKDELTELLASRSEWVPLAKGLPVVPEGAIFVKLWIFSHHGQVKKVSWHRDCEIDMAFSFTHWMYRQDDTPAPPRSES